MEVGVGGEYDPTNVIRYNLYITLCSYPICDIGFLALQTFVACMHGYIIIV